MMYKNSGTGSKIEPKKVDTLDKKVDELEGKMKLLAEELHQMRILLRQTSRISRRQNSEINILSSAVRRAK